MFDDQQAFIVVRIDVDCFGLANNGDFGAHATHAERCDRRI